MGKPAPIRGQIAVFSQVRTRVKRHQRGPFWRRVCYQARVLRYDFRLRIFAVCLAALAGYVDALAFIELGGFFVSFMSGNSTRLGVGLEGVRESHNWAVAGGLILSFVSGVVAGTVVGRLARRGRHVVLLFCVAGLLAAAAACNQVGFTAAAVAAMAFAMGVENTVFERDGEVSIGLTYMTGTLVKLGQRIASALFGGDRFAWAAYLSLWMGLVAGAIAGAMIYPHLGLSALWFAALAAAALALSTYKTSLGG